MLVTILVGVVSFVVGVVTSATVKAFYAKEEPIVLADLQSELAKVEAAIKAEFSKTTTPVVAPVVTPVVAPVTKA